MIIMLHRFGLLYDQNRLLFSNHVCDIGTIGMQNDAFVVYKERADRFGSSNEEK